MKIFLFCTVLAALCTATGCTMPEKDGAARYLPESEICYSITSYRELFRNLDLIAARLHTAIQAADMPEAQKQEWSVFLAALQLAAVRAGLDEDLTAGTSSLRLPGEKPLFRTTRVLATSNPEPGFLWKITGNGVVHVQETLADIPADAILVLSAMLDAEQITRQIQQAAAGLAPGQFPVCTDPAENLSGNWRLILRSGKDGAFYAELHIPDRKKSLQTILQTLLPAGSDGVLRFPRKGQVPPVLFRLREDAVTLEIGKVFPPPGSSLLQTPALREKIRHLPEQGAGIFYLSSGAARALADQTGLLAAVRDVPEILGVLTAQQNALILQTVSDWDPVSEAWLLPLAFMRPMPLFAAGLKTGQEVRDSALARQKAAGCTANMLAIRKALMTYAASHQGNFPAGHAVEGLQELLKAGAVTPDKLVCPAATGDIPAESAQKFTADNCSYVYVGGSTGSTPPDFPQVFDWPLNHKDHFHVLTVGGEVKTFYATNIRSCRKLASFLQSRFLYPEQDFRRLLEVADKLDSIFLKGHSK